MTGSLLRSLRVKLLMMFVAVFGLLMVIVGMVSIAAQERQLRQHFDERLAERVESMLRTVQGSATIYSPQFIQELIERESRSIFFRDFYVQILGQEGELLGVSENLDGFMLPTGSVGVGGNELNTGYFETVVGPAVEQVAGAGQTMRMVTRRSVTADGEPFYLQVATSLEAVDASLSVLENLYYGASAVGLLAAALAGWYVAGSVVKRINRIARLAAEVGPHNLSQRIGNPSATDEIAELVLRLNSMLDRLETGYHSQERFIQDASHELKTPIATLLTQAQVLSMKSPEPAEMRTFFRSVEEEMRRLGRIVESLLTLTRVDRLRELKNARNVAVSDVVLDAVEQCRSLAQRHRVQVNVQITQGEEEEDLEVFGDPDLLSIAISNLLRNAIRFCSPEERVSVLVEAGDPARIIVQDCGPGLPEEDLESLFNRFQRGTPDLSRRGSGLGLAIVKTVITLHQGSVEARNRLTGGAEFVVALPRATRRGSEA